MLESADLPLAAVFDVEGGPAPAEEELALPGRRRSQPVRVGARPARARTARPDLDVYGDLVAAVAEARPTAAR